MAADAPGRMRPLAVAISGGGHRACLFGLGALLYLADAGRNAAVTSIASVSGGSMANAAIAQGIEFTSADRDAVEKVVARVARRIARRGTVLAAPITWAWLLLAVVVGAAALAGPWLTAWPVAAKIAAFAAGLVVWGWVLALRGAVTGRAFARTLLGEPGRPLLHDMHAELDHVICATDLHAGEHVYFARDFVCAYRFGLGGHGSLPLHVAVQASAAFPGVFPVRWLRTARFAFQAPGDDSAGAWLALHDGGVYDNMGDQWAQGLERRTRRWASLSPQFRPAHELVVVNGSAGMGWTRAWTLRIPLLGGLVTLLRDKSVLYDNGNSLRRQELVARFDLAERDGTGLRGALVHIPQSPFDVPDHFAGDAARQWPDRASRARVAIGLLERDPGARAAWQEVADADARVATTLVALGEEVTARLLWHGYVLAMTNLHVVLDHPLLDVPELERFQELAREP